MTNPVAERPAKDEVIFPTWVYSADGQSMIVHSQEELDKANETGEWRESPAEFTEAEVVAALHPVAAAKAGTTLGVGDPGFWSSVAPKPSPASDKAKAAPAKAPDKNGPTPPKRF